MKNKFKLLAIAVMLLLSIIVSAQETSFDKLIDEGKILSKTAYLHYSKDQLLEARTIFENSSTADQSNLLPL